MRLMYDAVDPNAVPRDAEMVAGYIDGNYRSYPGLVARCPNAVHVAIVVSASTDAGQVLDVEQGDATPDQAPSWCQRRRKAGQPPTVYCSESEWPAVRAAFQRAGVPEPEWWIAAYPGRPPYNGPVLYPGSVAHQYGSNPAGTFDLSVVADHWPGVDQAGPPPAPQMEAPEMFFSELTDGRWYLFDASGAVPISPTLAYMLTATGRIPNVTPKGGMEPLEVVAWNIDHGRNIYGALPVDVT